MCWLAQTGHSSVSRSRSYTKHSLNVGLFKGAAEEWKEESMFITELGKPPRKQNRFGKEDEGTFNPAKGWSKLHFMILQLHARRYGRYSWDGN